MICFWVSQNNILRLCLIFIMFAVLPAFKKNEDCYATAASQLQLNQCAAENAKNADAELDGVYKKLIAKTSLKNKNRLQAAKEAWTIYRTKQCEFDSLGTIDGSIHPMVVSQCYAESARDYIKILQNRIECQEGDLSCGGQ